MTAAPRDPALVGDREIVLSRVFDAPPERVYRAWTDPEQVARWWGPRGFTTTIERMEVKPGGVWRYTMHGPDGTDYQNRMTFLEVVPGRRLVSKHGDDKGTEPVTHQTTVTFEPAGPGGSQTRVTLSMLFDSAAARDFVVNTYGAIEGGKQTLACLAEHLAGAAPGAQREFVISRVLAAPRERVFDAWTKQDQLMRWFGPRGFTMTRATLDLRPGGTFHYCLRGPDGKDMWGKFVYREIVPLERIVLVSSFSDEQGNLTRHPMSPDWPREMLSTTTFEDHAGKGRGTLVTIRWSPLNPTEAERKTFDSSLEGMKQGWTGAFEQLEEYLAG